MNQKIKLCLGSLDDDSKVFVRNMDSKNGILLSLNGYTIK